MVGCHKGSVLIDRYVNDSSQAQDGQHCCVTSATSVLAAFCRLSKFRSSSGAPMGSKCVYKTQAGLTLERCERFPGPENLGVMRGTDSASPRGWSIVVD